MNEWVGPDINVVGSLEIPPSDEFSISESSHLFGKFTCRKQLTQRWKSTAEESSVWLPAAKLGPGGPKCERQHANMFTT